MKRGYNAEMKPSYKTCSQESVKTGVFSMMTSFITKGVLQYVIKSVDIARWHISEMGISVCILHERTTTHVNSGHLTHGNKVYTGPKMGGIQNTLFWYTNNGTDHQH